MFFSHMFCSWAKYNLSRVGLSVITTLTPYGDTLRLHRRWMQNYMGSSTAMKHIKGVQELEARRLLLRMMESPDQFMDHLRTSVLYSYVPSCFSLTNSAAFPAL